MKKLRAYFFTGLIAVLPIFFTVFIFIKTVDFIMRTLRMMIPFDGIISIFNALFNLDQRYFKFFTVIIVYFISLVLILFIIFIVGVLIVHIFDSEKIRYIERFFMKIPLAKPIYSTLKEISKMVFSQSENAYKKVVIVEYPRKGIYSVGFITREKNTCFSKEMCKNDLELTNVFIPTSPNPTSGMFLMFDKKELIEIDMRIDDAIKLIVSGGAIIPKSTQEEIK